MSRKYSKNGKANNYIFIYFKNIKDRQTRLLDNS